MNYTLVDEKGKIVQTGTHPDSAAVAANNPECTVYPGFYQDDIYYYKNGFKQRPKIGLPESISANINEDVILLDIPEGCTVITPEGAFVVDDGEVIFSSADPGIFYLYFDCFPYKAEVVKIEIT